MVFLFDVRYVRRDLWRNKAIEIRVAFERNRNVRDPRAVANLLNQAEKEVQRMSHPDPYKRKLLITSSSCNALGESSSNRIFGPSQPPCSPTAQSGQYPTSTHHVGLRHPRAIADQHPWFILQGAQLAAKDVHPGREGRCAQQPPLDRSTGRNVAEERVVARQL